MIAFVILHFQMIEDTNESIRYIKKNAGRNDYKIIVVDNASPNGTGKLLQELYFQDSFVEIVLSDTNLGFSGGNNIGYLKAKNEYKADFIILMNNDVNLISVDFINKIEQIYHRKKFAVLGPLILTADGRCDSNPVSKEIRTVNEVNNSIKLYEKRIRWILCGLEPLRKKIIKQKKQINFNFLEESEGVRLHGSFWVFSPIYVSKFDGIDNGTFMYMEEDILQFHMKKENMVMLYSPEIAVFHKEGVATSNGVSSKEKLIRKYRWLIEANKYYLGLLTSDEVY